MQDYELARAMMAEHPSWCDFEGPRGETLVALAETKLGLTFPPTYRRFLLELGTGTFGTAEFYGVIHDNFEDSSAPDAIWYTMSERRQGRLPSDLIVVGSHDEGLLLVEGSPGRNAEGKVIEIVGGYPLDQQEQGVIAADFGEYLRMSVALQIEMRRGGG
jgi:hypothetical protein